MAARVDTQVRNAIRGCYVAGDDLASLRKRLMQRIRRIVTLEAAFFGGADPETLLFTSLSAEAPLAASAALFLANEFGATFDVNRFASLAGAERPFGTFIAGRRRPQRDRAARGRSAPQDRRRFAPRRTAGER